MTPVALQLAKMIIGGVLALAMLSIIVVAMLTKNPLEPETVATLIGAAIVAGGVAGHGALKTPTKGDGQ